MRFPTLRLWALLLMLVSVCGCGFGGGPTWDPGSVKGSLATIEGSVQDINSQLVEMSKRKKGGPRDLGSDSDRIGFYLSALKKSAQGTPVQADAEDFEKKFIELERVFSSRASLDKVQDAMKQVQDSLATIKAKL